MALAVRTAAAQVIGQILRHQGSLSSVLPPVLSRVADSDRALLQELCFGTLRWQPKLNAYLLQLVDKPLRAKDSDIQALLLLGLYQLIYTRIPDHAAIGETVEVTRGLKKAWATKLVNGVLRRFQREKAALDSLLETEPAFATAHPSWLIDTIRHAWPEDAEQILAANNTHPPFTLRVNPRQQSRADYLQALADQGIDARATAFSAVGITLDQACDPRGLPLFAAGGISVQDEAAQLTADLLELAPGQRVLDACCAPGGKTGLILETEPALAQMVALDSDERRLTRVHENLARLNLVADIRCGDAAQPASWWDGKAFDRILLDAPCSATGIIRRHPDIKLLRTPDDIARLAELQGRMLDALWPLLKPDGILLYATCSIMPAENTQVVEAFITRQLDAQLDQLEEEWGIAQPAGRQLLPDVEGHDGFYYARLRKRQQ